LPSRQISYREPSPLSRTSVAICQVYPKGAPESSFVGVRGRAGVLVVAASALSIGLTACGSDSTHATPAPERRAPAGASTTSAATSVPAGLDGTVVSVTDGDTIKVRLTTGDVERVRLTGIDTPETKDPRTVVECFGREAAAETLRLLPEGTAVRLETDVELRDRYRRLLAYVWRLPDGLFVNEFLVRDGWAAPYRYPPNVKYADELSRLGAAARAANRGLWGACGGTNTPATP
jgi:micrococcal nuclease